ncbi:MAG TPA: hypothetical protein DCM40_20215, partial [Maribacter sp.]|nr:hypothetical protein [Maribacter sp.]
GSNTGPFDSSGQIQIFAGEALWEAGDKAGIVIPQYDTTTGEELAPIFQLSPSSPWFNDYDDFNYLLKKVSTAKEFVVIPEYRSSMHADDYFAFGKYNENKENSFNIPGTSLNSLQDNFYIDYSNSEFLREFLNINELTRQQLSAAEIRLVCSGAIRFNPYKGFYPAQRTVDLVEKFDDVYSQQLMFPPIGSGSWGDFGYLLGVSGSQIKSVYQPLFAPGILYNTIKSGLAVDWPIVTDYTKVQRTQYGDNTNAAPNNWAISANPTQFTANENFWDKRLDFETIIYPEDHIKDIALYDMD